jgi:osmotically-inducible protein OsmY
MNKFMLGLLSGVVLTFVGVWYLGSRDVNARTTGDQPEAKVAQTQEMVKRPTDALKLSAQDISEEMTRAGKVVRAKMNAGAHEVADAAADAGTTTAIKAKYVADPDVSALSISVNTTGGVVTLSGTASSSENIRKAMQLAYDTDGVNQVVSTIQVKE